MAGRRCHVPGLASPGKGTDMPKATCSIDGCERPARTRGWCQMHYRIEWRAGRLAPLPPRTEATAVGRPLPERFWSKVNKTDTCWLWTAALNHGYGTFHLGTDRGSHRVAYESLIGPIPDGLHLDHLCRVPACVNPAHLEPVTPGENTRRGERSQRTHCPQGHPYTPENTRITVDRSGYRHRLCCQCQRAYQARYAHRSRTQRRRSRRI